jgi:uroporphyrinogen-III synthase
MKTVLYLGTDPKAYSGKGKLVHYPVLKLVPRPIPPHILDDMDEYTHYIFTSKNAVSIFFESIGTYDLSKKVIIAIGPSTATRLEQKGCPATHVAEEETQEGVIALLRMIDLEDAYILLPHSALARKLLEDFLVQRGIRHQVCDLYDTFTQKNEPLPNLEEIDEIIFTSPSTVRAFVEIFSRIPDNKTLTCIGPVTQQELTRMLP